MNKLTIFRLKELFEYNPITGLFIRLTSVASNARKGDIAGSKSKEGYICLNIDYKVYKAHRLAWFYVHGVWPKDLIDHINVIRDDNRIANLREATRKLNMENQNRPHKSNKIGILGVAKIGNKFKARIRCDKKDIFLGYFKTPELAHQAYLSAKRQYHKGCTI